MSKSNVEIKRYIKSVLKLKKKSMNIKDTLLNAILS